MENALFLARLLGTYFIIVAIGISFNRQTYQKVMEDFCKNSALVYLGGILALFFGLLIVLFHNVWMANWLVIITIFGWGGIIKGIWLIVFPKSVAKFAEVYKKKANLLTLHLILAFALGIFLSIKGYWG